jgi:hypothetical protein
MSGKTMKRKDNADKQPGTTMDKKPNGKSQTKHRTQFLVVVAALCFGFTYHARAQSFLTNGLVAYYPFNGNANDATGNGFNGIISSNCWFVPDRFENPDYALLFQTTRAWPISTPGEWTFQL